MGLPLLDHIEGDVWEVRTKPGKMDGLKVKRNRHEGSSFDDFLKDEGVYEDVEAAAIKKVIAIMLAEEMKSQKISKVAMVRRIGTRPNR